MHLKLSVIYVKWNLKLIFNVSLYLIYFKKNVLLLILC